jgi:cell division protein FtsB
VKVPRRTPAARPTRDLARPGAGSGGRGQAGAGHRPGTRAARTRTPGRTDTAAPPPPRAVGKRSPFTRRAAVFATVLFLVAVSVAYPAQRYVAQRKHIDDLRADVTAGTERVAALQRDKALLGQEFYIERQARARLHFVMPGDRAFRVEDPQVVTGEAPATGGVPAVAADAWWERMLGSVTQASVRVEPVPAGTRTAPAAPAPVPDAAPAVTKGR